MQRIEFSHLNLKQPGPKALRWSPRLVARRASQGDESSGSSSGHRQVPGTAAGMSDAVLFLNLCVAAECLCPHT